MPEPTPELTPEKRVAISTDIYDDLTDTERERESQQELADDSIELVKSYILALDDIDSRGITTLTMPEGISTDEMAVTKKVLIVLRDEAQHVANKHGQEASKSLEARRALTGEAHDWYQQRANQESVQNAAVADINKERGPDATDFEQTPPEQLARQLEEAQKALSKASETPPQE